MVIPLLPSICFRIFSLKTIKLTGTFYDVTDGTNFATFLLNGPSAADQIHDFKELTVDALKPALEAHTAYTKDIVLRLFRIMDDWYTKRDTFWSTVKDSGKQWILYFFYAALELMARQR